MHAKEAVQTGDQLGIKRWITFNKTTGHPAPVNLGRPEGQIAQMSVAGDRCGIGLTPAVHSQDRRVQMHQAQCCCDQQ